MTDDRAYTTGIPNLIYFWISVSHSNIQNLTRSKIFGRAWLPIWSRSWNPCVMTSAVLSPFLSNSALVATVVPMRIHPKFCVERCSPGGYGTPVSCKCNLKLKCNHFLFRMYIRQARWINAALMNNYCIEPMVDF